MTNIPPTDNRATSHSLQNESPTPPERSFWEDIDLDRIEPSQQHTAPQSQPNQTGSIHFPLPVTRRYVRRQTVVERLSEQLTSSSSSASSHTETQITLLKQHYLACIDTMPEQEQLVYRATFRMLPYQQWETWHRFCKLYQLESVTTALLELWQYVALHPLRESSKLLRRELPRHLSALTDLLKIGALKAWMSCPIQFQHILKNHEAQHWVSIRERLNTYHWCEDAIQKTIVSFSFDRWQFILGTHGADQLSEAFTLLGPIAAKVQSLRHQQLIETCLLTLNIAQLVELNRLWQIFFCHLANSYHSFNLMDALLQKNPDHWANLMKIASEIANENTPQSIDLPFQKLLTLEETDWEDFKDFYRSVRMGFTLDENYALLQSCIKIPKHEQDLFLFIALSHQDTPQISFDIYAHFLADLTLAPASERINIHEFLFSSQLPAQEDSQSSLFSSEHSTRQHEHLERLTAENVMDEQKTNRMQQFVQILCNRIPIRNNWPDTLTSIVEKIHQQQQTSNETPQQQQTYQLYRLAHKALTASHLEDLSPPFSLNAPICTWQGQPIGTGELLHMVWTTSQEQIQPIEDPLLRQTTSANLEHSLYVALASCMEDGKRVCKTGIGQRLGGVPKFAIWL